MGISDIYSRFSIPSHSSLRLSSQMSRRRQGMRQMLVYLSTLSLGEITFGNYLTQLYMLLYEFKYSKSKSTTQFKVRRSSDDSMSSGSCSFEMTSQNIQKDIF